MFTEAHFANSNALKVTLTSESPQSFQAMAATYELIPSSQKPYNPLAGSLRNYLERYRRAGALSPQSSFSPFEITRREAALPIGERLVLFG